MSDFDLRDLEAFLAVARTRNFRRAAVEQRVSASSLSHRLRGMEERLGVRLMNRTTRSVALTEAGELLLARAAPALLDVGAALDQVRRLREVPAGRLRIKASPHHVAQHGRPRHPKDLLDQACIRTRFGSGAMLDWEFEKAGRVVKVAPPAKLVATYLGLAMRAALDGVGFWLTFEGYVREAVQSDALTSVLEDWCAPFPGPFLYYPSRRQPPPALAAFVAFVGEWRKQDRRRLKKT